MLLQFIILAFGQARYNEVTREAKEINFRGVRPDYEDTEIKAQDRGPRPDYNAQDEPISISSDDYSIVSEDSPAFRAAKDPKAGRKAPKFKTKCEQGQNPRPEARAKCNLDGKPGTRLVCKDGKVTKESIISSKLCEPPKDTFSMRLEHSWDEFGYGTLFVLDHGRRPENERGSAGTVCMGRGSTRFTDDDKLRLCKEMGYKNIMSEGQIEHMNYRYLL